MINEYPVFVDTDDGDWFIFFESLNHDYRREVANSITAENDFMAINDELIAHNKRYYNVTYFSCGTLEYYRYLIAQYHKTYCL